MSEQAVITETPEIMVYFEIDACGSFIWRMNHDMAHGRIESKQHKAIDEDVERVREQQKKAVLQCKRFGVEPNDAEGNPTPDYWKWYRWWDAWKKGLSDEEWRKVDVAVSRKEGPTEEELLSYRPEGSWLAEAAESKGK